MKNRFIEMIIVTGYLLSVMIICITFPIWVFIWIMSGFGVVEYVLDKSFELSEKYAKPNH